MTFYPDDCQGKNQACYSRSLNGTYCVTENSKSLSRLEDCTENCENCPSENQLQFFHGCPNISDSTWRGGDMKPDLDLDLKSKFSSEKLRCNMGWLCMSRDRCRDLYGKNVIYHCDDERCLSGSCFAPRSAFGENKEALRCHQTAYKLIDEKVLGSNYPDLSPGCRLGYTKREGSLENECIPCVGVCRRQCDFCQQLKLSDAKSLLNVMGCTEIRTVGGIIIRLLVKIFLTLLIRNRALENAKYR